MALSRWKKVAEETAHRNPWWSYKRDTVILPSGSRGEYHYVHTPGSVMIVPRLADGRLVLVRQFRYLNDRESIEFPAGGIKPGQDAGSASEAELREEAGFTADAWRVIGSFNPFNGVTDELCTVFLAQGLTPCEAVPDETEEFEVLYCTESEIRGMIVDGRVWDGMSLAAWSFYLAGSAGDE